jgi:hypothetical protein
MPMTFILLQMYSHIDTEKRFNDRQDTTDSDVILTRSHDHHLGYTGFSLDDFNGVHMKKRVPSKRDLLWFSISGHTKPSKKISWTQSQAYMMRYMQVSFCCYSTFHNDKYVPIL